MSDEEYAYLQPGFNARTLRKDQLRNILLTHGVAYDDTMLKPQLLELYQQQIVPQRDELRRQFVDVTASAANIEATTPPKARKGTKKPTLKADTQLKPEAVEDEPASPRARRQARRVKLKKSSPEPTSSMSVKIDDAPVLNPPSSAGVPPSDEIPTSPASPRRKRANRKVDGAPDVPPTSSGEIKVKAPPRSRKRGADEAGEDESFSSNNIFQNSTPKRKKTSASSTQSRAPSVPFLPPPPAEALTTELNLDQIQVDPEFVAEINAAVENDPISMDPAVFDAFLRSQALEQIEEVPIPTLPLESTSDQSEKTLAKPSSKQKEAKPKAEKKAEPKVETKLVTPDTRHAPRFEARSDSRSDLRSARRGFMPSIADLRVSNAFAEQLEPFLAATPAQTPAQTPVQTPRHASPSIIVEKKTERLPKPAPKPSRDSSVELPDATKFAAEHIHNAIEPKVEHFVQSLPRFKLPQLHFRLPRINWPAVFAALTSASQNGLVFAFYIAATILSASLITLGALTIVWTREQYREVEICGVGAYVPPTYPGWTEFDTSNKNVAQLQEYVRSRLDVLRPECLECPEHARCYQARTVTCESGYKAVDPLLSRLGVWPLLKQCLPDWELQRKQAVISEEAVHVLRQRRAEVLCHQEADGDPEEIDAAMSDEEVCAEVYSRKSSMLTDEEFAEIWSEVVEQIANNYNDVYVIPELRDGADGNHAGTLASDINEEPETAAKAVESSLKEAEYSGEEVVYFVSTSDVLVPLGCRLRLKVRQWYLEHRAVIIQAALVSFVLLNGTLFIRDLRARARREKETVNRLIGVIRAQRELASADATGRTESTVRAWKLLAEEVPQAQRPHYQKLVESVEGVRSTVTEVHGEMSRLWDWTL